MIVLKNNNWQIATFYICSLLFYPLIWVRLFKGRMFDWSELNLFTPGLIALLCCSFILLNSKELFSFFSSRKAKLIALAFAFILLISFVQIAVCYNGQIHYLWTSLYWIAIPLFCAVNRREVEKKLPLFIILLGLATIFQSLYELKFNYSLVGITGNRNWNACLIVLALPFFCLGIHKYFRKNFKVPVISLVLIVNAVLLYKCQSKGVVLSLILACLSILILHYWKKIPWIYWLRGGILLTVCAVVALLALRGYLVEFLKNDQRLFLWSGALDLIKQNLWFGCGPELFESAYAPHISADYYFGKFISNRHLHTHNHFLHFAATMGIPALISWCSVLFYVLGKNLRRAAGQGNWTLKLYLFVFIFLLIYSMLDVVVFTWPLGSVFLILFGILLARALEDSPKKEFKENKTAISLCSAGAIVLTIILLNYLYYNFTGSMHYRRARLLTIEKNIKPAFEENKKSIAAKKTPQNIYLAAKISLYDFKNPLACLKYLDQVNSLGFENYEHNNLLRAKALVAIGNAQDSLLYFAKEQQNFPLSCVNLHYYQIALKILGKKKQAAAVDQHLKNILKEKGFSEEMLPELLKNPHKDLRFRYHNGEEK